ncbi:efflux RND transporter permease subunit [Acidisphaera sp. L21]|uniref:efflux RND transporter permease subunit n=1 Tax=Acidisphaera sp. L21 TaxID=1641851 RepID=UPI00131C1D53|nr:efflux RND transporter permease subunit [Acidisphaera sp. L21]
MKISHFFIDHPIFASVLSIVLTVIGAIALQRLPVSEYPDIAPPTVNIVASYPGASAEVIAATVAGPIEQEVNGVDDMLYVESESTGDGPQRSPHSVQANNPLNSCASETAFAKAVMSGTNLCSGMLGISS